MKATTMTFLAATTVLLAGCGQQSDMTANQPEAPKQPVTANEVKEQYKDALKTTKDYAVQNKDEFVASAAKQLQDLDTKIAELGKKAEVLKDDAKAQADKALEALKAQRATLAQKYDELKNASADGWDKTKDAFTVAWADVEKAYDDAKSKFN
jgi:uncharacterized phage infection (PIP) family protein YhgE